MNIITSLAILAAASSASASPSNDRNLEDSFGGAMNMSMPSFTGENGVVGDNGSPAEAFPLAKCQGDCDDDSECAQGLYCFRRDGAEDVPGCVDVDNRGTDYCFDPQDDQAVETMVGSMEYTEFGDVIEEEVIGMSMSMDTLDTMNNGQPMVPTYAPSTYVPTYYYEESAG
jgi:hypothetical protein